MSMHSLKLFGMHRAIKRMAADACVLKLTSLDQLSSFDTIPSAPMARGIEIVNHRTNGVARFVFVEEQFLEDGRLKSWRFKVHPGTVAVHPAMAGFELFIWHSENTD
jgi:hypothetical protein